MKKFVLGIQGGGCRGVYSVGVMNVLMKNNLWAEEVIGCSAGGIFGMNYVSQEIGRGDKVAFILSKDKRFFKTSRMWGKKKTMFDYDYFLNEITKEKIPFDKENFYSNEIGYKVVVTSCIDSSVAYIDKHDEEFEKGVEASAALPLTASPVFLHGIPYLDGGVACPIPFDKFIEDGKEKIVVISTREKGYRKKGMNPFEKILLKLMYKKYPDVMKTYFKQKEVYNSVADKMDKLHDEGRIFVIYPSRPPKVGNADMNTKKLQNLINLGYKDAEAILPSLMEYLSK